MSTTSPFQSDLSLAALREILVSIVASVSEPLPPINIEHVRKLRAHFAGRDDFRAAFLCAEDCARLGHPAIVQQTVTVCNEVLIRRWRRDHPEEAVPDDLLMDGEDPALRARLALLSWSDLGAYPHDERFAAERNDRMWDAIIASTSAGDTP